jgi:serine protease
MPNDSSTRWTRRSILRTTTAAGAAALVGTGPATGRPPGAKEDEVLVGVSAGRDLVETVQPGVPADAEIVHENDTLRYVAVAFADAGSAAMDDFIAAVQQRDGVTYAEVDTTHEAFYEPNDPYYSQQCAPQAVNADDAWDCTLGDPSVTLAVVDTGVQYSHPDLDDNFASDPGYDFVDSDSDPAPDDPSTEYHGTHVSGIAAAETDNGEGIAGISEATLINGRALDESGRGSTSDIADAIQWAADRDAEVINLSLGGGGYTSTMKNAVSYAYENGALLIAAAGNDGTEGVSYPAAYEECLAVAAIDCTGEFATYSNYGSEVELCAPGDDVLSTTTDARGSYERLSGTSMATAVVSGVACLVESKWGDLTPNELRKHLDGTADDIGLSGDRQGCGRVDAYDAVKTDPDERARDCGGICGSQSSTVSFESSLDGTLDSDCWSWSWEYGDPCEVVVELDGPADADFDLYANEGTGDCPTTLTYTHSSTSDNSQERIVIEHPDTSEPLYVLVDANSGSGSYTLSITEKAS